MKKVLVGFTDELMEVIDAAKGSQDRNPFIEDALWASPYIVKTAQEMGVGKPERPSRGRRGNQIAQKRKKVVKINGSEGRSKAGTGRKATRKR
jgi:hypothetical protein